MIDEAICGYDVGDPPDSCRCLLMHGHAGLHRCEHDERVAEKCRCGQPVHYFSGHRPDTSQPGMTVQWCMCGGSGKFHHGPAVLGYDPKAENE